MASDVFAFARASRNLPSSTKVMSSPLVSKKSVGTYSGSPPRPPPLRARRQVEAEASGVRLTGVGFPPHDFALSAKHAAWVASPASSEARPPPISPVCTASSPVA